MGTVIFGTIGIKILKRMLNSFPVEDPFGNTELLWNT